jgi:uncharacterized protein YndB with AHSA1/START domain
MTTSPVVRTVTVDTAPETAFAIFTDRIVDWWPLATHTPNAELALDLAFVDGALVETSPDGRRSTWGRVVEWDPPRRLSLTWSPSQGPESRVSVDFEDSGDQTRVVLTHDGWEAYGDRAAEYRDNYAGESAWGWVLALYGWAAHNAASRGAIAVDAASPRSVVLRSGYEQVAVALLGGPFDDAEPGEWNARQVAGHVTTNAEMMCRVVDDVVAGRVARLYGPDDHAAAATGRYDGVELDDAAADLRRHSAGLVARYAGLSDLELATPVTTYIEHHGSPVVDGEMSLGDLFGAEIAYHLPAHVGQIQDLRATASAVVD